MRTLAVVAALPLLLVSCSPQRETPRVHVVTVDAGTTHAQVDPRFLSVAVDATQVVGGHFWAPDGDPSVEGTELVPPYDFSVPKLRALAGALAPAYLRIGGTEADRIWYDLADTPATAAPDPFRWVLTRTMWDGLNDFAVELGYRVLFTLNAGPGPRDANGRWTPDNARLLVEYAVAQGNPVDLWELGNELNAFGLIHDLPITGPEFALDVAIARTLVDDVHPEARLGAPSVAFWPVAGELNPFYESFMAEGGGLLDVVTWHYYPQQSRRCPASSRRAGPEVMLVPGNLDEAAAWASFVETGRDTHAPAAKVWLGETGNAQCGGEPGVSDAFAGGFWWLDQLGLMARRGQPIVVRQTLSGSNYGLLDHTTLDPNPDYWNSLLWRRLMGTTVLAATPDAADPMVRVYAHCTRDDLAGRTPGSVTVLALNLDPDRARDLRLDGLGEGPREVYLVTADGLDDRTIDLNGVELAAAPDGTPPAFEPRVQAGAGVNIPARAYAFVVLPQAGAAACP